MTPTMTQLTGTGLITGLPIEVTLEAAPVGAGITFYTDGVAIPACDMAVVMADRGVTLGREGKTLSIVEHFLSACAMANVLDLNVTLKGAPELPFLDGSAAAWFPYLQGFQSQRTLPPMVLQQSVQYIDAQQPQIQLWAMPSAQLKLSYLVDFPHPDMQRRWLSWQADSGCLQTEIAPARTFGFVRELPELQARGLAKGVTLENTLGLTDEGGYTTPLRMPYEPIRHKILDLIGDLMLCGIPIQQLQAHIVVYWGGHAAHVAFGRLLKQHLP